LEGKQIGFDQKKSLKESSWFGESKCKLRFKNVHFKIKLLFFIVFFYLGCLNYVRVKNMLWIENIVESTPNPSFFINSRIDMAAFVNPY
jgi:hypothetical protein